jgi:hypothetical protein
MRRTPNLIIAIGNALAYITGLAVLIVFRYLDSNYNYNNAFIVPGFVGALSVLFGITFMIYAAIVLR